MSHLSKPSRADRLHAIIAKFHPAAAASHAKDGRWPDGRAPYVIQETAKGRRVTVSTPDGDALSGEGATLELALDALAAKVGLAEKGAKG